jgi:hypothetical protein
VNESFQHDAAEQSPDAIQRDARSRSLVDVADSAAVHADVLARAQVADPSPPNRFLVVPRAWDWVGRLFAIWVALTVVLLVAAELQPHPYGEYCFAAALASGTVLNVACMALAVTGVLFGSHRPRMRDAFLGCSDTICERTLSEYSLSLERNRKEQPGEPPNDAIRLDADPADQRPVQNKPD